MGQSLTTGAGVLRAAGTVRGMTNPPFGFSMPGGPGGPDPNDPAQLQAFLAQMQQMLANPGSGPVNWDLARQVAQSQLKDDPAIATPQKSAVEEALRLADLWLDAESSLPSGIHYRRGVAPGRLAGAHPRRLEDPGATRSRPA